MQFTDLSRNPASAARIRRSIYCKVGSSATRNISALRCAVLPAACISSRSASIKPGKPPDTKSSKMRLHIFEVPLTKFRFLTSYATI
jgi:hypothetical protein